MQSFQNRVAVITGAASGIGLALAQQLHREGCQLALSDINFETLSQNCASLLKAGPRVELYALNVAEREAVFKHAEAVMTDFGQVDLVFNNAGVTVFKDFTQTSQEDFEWLMEINFWGVLYGCQAFLPQLSDDGLLVNLSSLFGFVGFPGQTAYCSSKFAVRGLTETLNQELRLSDKKVRALCVHPGGIKTQISRSARFGNEGDWVPEKSEVIANFEQRMARLSPEQAAKIILRGVRQRRARIIVGADAQIMTRIARFLPFLYPLLFILGIKIMKKRSST